MNSIKIPLVDLHAQYLTIKNEIDAAIETVLRESSFIRGEHVTKFEENFSHLVGTPYCVSCGNGTDALYIVMKMLGIGPGDEVITTAHSWIATSETISQTGARVVFIDTTEHTFTIDPGLIESKITDRTKAIIPVHLFGHPADMDPIANLARKYNLLVIEDCSQAHLAEYKEGKVGTFGHAATFSFYPGKNLGAMGDAGCILTGDEELNEKFRRFANHGSLKKHDHTMEGINSRMDGLQAAILNVKLKKIEAWTQRRIEIASFYFKALHAQSDITLPSVENWAKHVFHLFVIKVRNRKSLEERLSQSGIQSTIQYPVALPFLEAYKYLGHSDSDFPCARRNQDLILSLPLYPEITNEQLEEIVSVVKDSSF